MSLLRQLSQDLCPMKQGLPPKGAAVKCCGTAHCFTRLRLCLRTWVTAEQECDTLLFRVHITCVTQYHDIFCDVL